MLLRNVTNNWIMESCFSVSNGRMLYETVTQGRSQPHSPLDCMKCRERILHDRIFLKTTLPISWKLLDKVQVKIIQISSSCWRRGVLLQLTATSAIGVSLLKTSMVSPPILRWQVYSTWFVAGLTEAELVSDRIDWHMFHFSGCPQFVIVEKNVSNNTFHSACLV